MGLVISRREIANIVLMEYEDKNWKSDQRVYIYGEQHSVEENNMN